MSLLSCVTLRWPRPPLSCLQGRCRDNHVLKARVSPSTRTARSPGNATMRASLYPRGLRTRSPHRRRPPRSSHSVPSQKAPLPHRGGDLVGLSRGSQPCVHFLLLVTNAHKSGKLTHSPSLPQFRAGDPRLWAAAASGPPAASRCQPGLASPLSSPGRQGIGSLGLASLVAAGWRFRSAPCPVGLSGSRQVTSAQRQWPARVMSSQVRAPCPIGQQRITGPHVPKGKGDKKMTALPRTLGGPRGPCHKHGLGATQHASLLRCKISNVGRQLLTIQELPVRGTPRPIRVERKETPPVVSWASRELPQGLASFHLAHGCAPATRTRLPSTKQAHNQEALNTSPCGSVVGAPALGLKGPSLPPSSLLLPPPPLPVVALTQGFCLVLPGLGEIFRTISPSR